MAMVFKHTLANPTTGRSFSGSTAQGDDTARVDKAALEEQSSVSPMESKAEMKMRRSVSLSPWLELDQLSGKSYSPKQTLSGMTRLGEGMTERELVQRASTLGRTSLMMALPLAFVSASVFGFARVCRSGSE